MKFIARTKTECYFGSGKTKDLWNANIRYGGRVRYVRLNINTITGSF